LYEIDIPIEGIDLFLEVIDDFDFINDRKLMRTIKKNVQKKNYDLEKLSDDFVNEILNYKDYKIISGSSDKTIKIWEVEEGTLLHTLNGHICSVFSVAFSSDNNKIVSGSSDKTIKIWDTKNCTLLHTLIGHTVFYSVAFSSDNLKIVSGSSDKTIKIWDAEKGTLLHTLNGHTNWVNAVAFSF